MRHSRLESVVSLTIWAVVTLSLVGIVASQDTQKKPSIWQQMKDAARQAQQGQPQQQPQPQLGQKPQKPGQGSHQAAGQLNDSRPFKPPAGTKIEETVLAPLQPGASFEISPHGVHVATVETSGSRAVVFYDGVEGLKFDQILNQGSGHVAFSPDGKSLRLLCSCGGISLRLWWMAKS